MKVQSGIPELCAAIRDRIVQSPHQRISFAEFMEMALYHPRYGYYAATAGQLGPQGDFVTASHLGGDFAELLAEQFVGMWERLGRPQPFDLVEMGPGQGLFAEAVLAYLRSRAPDCLAALRYWLVETSPALRQAQQQRLQPWERSVDSLQWLSLEELPQASITGVLVSNELVDAFPVHRVVVTETGLQEQYVTLADHADSMFKLTVGDVSTPAIAQYFDAIDIDLTSPTYPIGFTTEVNLAALGWMEQVARVLARGYVLTIDYGYSAERYYRPSRSRGTLQCYFKHAHHDDALINVGQQDITAHVDFTTLERQGERNGLETLGQLPQEIFLMALGLGDRFNDLAQLQGTDSATITYALRRREALHQLINPMGMGTFTVLIQGRGLTQATQRQLKGLTIPSTV